MRFIHWLTGQCLKEADALQIFIFEYPPADSFCAAFMNLCGFRHGLLAPVLAGSEKISMEARIK